MSAQQELVTKIEALLRRKYGSVSEVSQKRLFTEHDKDSDGKVGEDELKNLLKEADVGNPVTRGTWARRIIQRVDSDSDNLVTWEEYRRAVLRSS